MKIAQINMIPYGSTGKIMFQIGAEASQSNHEVRYYYTQPFDKAGKKERTMTDESCYRWGTFSENKIHYYLGSTLGRNGCFSNRGTRQLLRELENFSPDVIHLHNLHKFCINFSMLFRYIKKNNIRVVWTLHDCWTFTGQCPYFTMVNCDKWKTGCHHCPQLNCYPKSRIDHTKAMYKHKKQWFTGVSQMTLVTPSNWLADLVHNSFLKEYPVQVIHNGIDLSVFQPTESDFRKKYHCENQFLLLGVAFGWGKRKGLDVWIELSNRLDERFQIVLVGTDDAIDRQLPEHIISIHKTQNQTELAEIYTAADLFVNPTREEVLGMVNIESLACGTPVLTFNTGGCPEIIDETCGSVVNCDDVDAMESEVLRIEYYRPFSPEACIARAERFNMNEKFKEYIKLYENCTYSPQRSV